MQVTIYTKPSCQPCRLTKKKFDQLGIPYVEADAREHVSHLASLGYRQAPVIEADFGDGATAHWAGYRPTCIDELYATLADKLTVPSVITPEKA